MTPATKQKRARLQDFIERVLVPETAVQAVIGIGSIATGHMRPDSDIDAIIFLDPFDPFIVPAEAIWSPSDDTFHSISGPDPQLKEEGLQLDFLRLDWQQWADPAFAWPEARRAELNTGWMAYDRSGKVAHTIVQRTRYPDDIRLKRLDQAIIWLDQHLSRGMPEQIWDELGPLMAHDRLEAAYENLVQLLFAYNRRWRIWRNREMSALLTLPWLPPNFEQRLLVAANAPTLDHEGYLARLAALRSLFDDSLAQLTAGGDYSNMPVDQAFLRQHEEPGRAWNMDEWNKFRLVRLMSDRGLDEMTYDHK